VVNFEQQILSYILSLCRKMIDNNFVCRLMVDFRKAFDTVCHTAFKSKGVGYNISPPIINWVLFS